VYIDQQRILDATNGGLDIILAYYPDAYEAVKTKGKKFKLRKDEKTASATLRLLSDGNYVVTDFGGDSKPRNAILICMVEESLSFHDAIQKLAADYKVTPEEYNPELYKPDIDKRDAKSEENEGEWYFDIRKGYTDFEIKTVLAEKSIPYVKDKEANDVIDYDKVARVFQQYHFHALTSYSIVKNRKVTTIKATDSYPIFMWDEGSFKKIYQPFHQDKGFRFIYYGKRPKQFLHGFPACQKAYDELQPDAMPEHDEEEASTKKATAKLPEIMYCSGGSDALNLAMIGYEVVWPNSETAKLTLKEFNKLKGLTDKVINIPDIDATGRRAAHQLALEYLELYTLYLPESLSRYRDRRGNFCKDVRDYLRFHNWYDFKQLIKTALPYQFWRVEYLPKKGGGYKTAYYVKNTRLYNFLGKNGFARLEIENEKDGYIYIQIENNIVRQIKANDVKNYVHEFLKSKKLDEDLRDMFYRSTQLGDTSMSNLPIIEIDFTDYDKDTQYFFFKNYTIKVTAGKIEEFKPGKIDRYVWEDEVIDHKMEPDKPQFKINKDKDGQWDISIKKKDNPFFNYLINTSRIHWRKELEDQLQGKKAEERNAYLKKHQFDIAGPNLSPEERKEQKAHLVNKIYALGYLLHRYRDPSRPWAVFAMDSRVSDDGESHGGSGKSICFKAPRLFMKSVTLDGRKPDLTKDQFLYENVNRHTDYILVDDANQYLNFQFFFSALTGELTVNPKNNRRFEMAFEDVPKFALTSNFVVRNLDSSTVRRLLYVVFSDYYHKNANGFYEEDRTVADEFGKNIVHKDYTDDEWNDFYSFMIQCCQFYLNHSKIEPPMDNVHKRNLISIMGNAFHEWADVYFSEDAGTLNDFVIRVDAFEDFKKGTRSNWTSQKFGKAIHAWCEYYGYELNPKDYHNDQGRIIRKVTRDSRDRAMEMLFIKTVKDVPGDVNPPSIAPF